MVQYRGRAGLVFVVRARQVLRQLHRAGVASQQGHAHEIGALLTLCPSATAAAFSPPPATKCLSNILSIALELWSELRGTGKTLLLFILIDGVQVEMVREISKTTMAGNSIVAGFAERRRCAHSIGPPHPSRTPHAPLTHPSRTRHAPLPSPDLCESLVP